MIERNKLYFGLPIKLEENVVLYQPTLKEILLKDISLEMVLEPFISLDKRNFKNEVDNDKIKNFDMFFLQIFTIYAEKFIGKEGNASIPTIEDWFEENKGNNGFVIQRLVKMLKFLFRTDDVQIIKSDKMLENLEENHILINGSYKIDRNNFDSLKDMVCEIFDTQIEIKKEDVEKLVTNKELDEMFAKKKREYEEKYGKKEEKEEKFDIFTLINYIIHSKNSQYNYNTVQELTIYQIKNTFKYYQNQEVYDIDMQYRTSGNFKMDRNQKHWFFNK